MLTGLIPLHCDGSLSFSMFTMADINKINSADFNTRLTFGVITIIVPQRKLCNLLKLDMPMQLVFFSSRII